MATKAKKSVKSNISKMAIVGVLSAIAYILMFMEFSVPLMPVFIKMDLSDFPALIGSLAVGPVGGIIIALIKNLLHLTVTSTGGVGELSNFILNAVFVLPAGLLYKKKKQTIEYKNSMERDWYYSTENIDSRLDFMYLIKDLNYDEKITITLFYLEDFTSSEIAKILKESESTIRNRLSRARRKIKENMEGDLVNG